MTSDEWKRRIAELAHVKQLLAEADVEGLWEWHLPAVGVPAEELRRVEERLGEPLHPEYLGFLAVAGGWPSFFQSVDLFGPGDLVEGPRHAVAQELLDGLDEGMFPAGFEREHSLPIAASAVDRDLFLIARRSSPANGEVVWLGGGEVDRWPGFDEFFLAMMDYNRKELEDLRARADTE